MIINFRHILFSVCFAAAISAAAQVRQKKVLFIIADGIPADVIEKVDAPNIRAIATAGRYMRAHVGGEKEGYSQTPTISAVGYNSLLTGTWVNKHNVWDNDIKDPNYHYFNIFRLLKEQHPEKKTAIFSSWTDNRTRLLGEGLAEAGNLELDEHFDGYELDTLRFPHDSQSGYMHKIDEAVADAAAENIRTKAPDLSWVYLEYTDDMGHKFGDSPQFYKAVQMMDAQVGRIWSAIEYRQKNFPEDWAIFITTDHGRDEKTGKGHGGQTPRQRTTWIVTNQPELNNYARYYQPAIVDIMPTIARFMNLSIDKKRAWEIDGTPLTGPVSVTDVKTDMIQQYIDVSWKALQPNGTVKIWLTLTNNFQEGKVDDYTFISEVPLANEHFLIDVSKYKSPFYKVVIEGADNTLNRWVMPVATDH